MLGGSARLLSPVASNRWRLVQNGDELAVLQRFPHHRMSAALLADGTEWRLAPHGWGTIVAAEDENELARIVRRSWWGRRWEIESQAFALSLVSTPAPRRWAFHVGNEPVAHLAGSILSYNRLRIDAPLAVPLVAVLLAWQVVVRPWELAAYPLALRPAPIRPARANPRPQPTI